MVGSPVLQKFLGTIHHTLSHKGFFVTTSTFSLAAEKFAAEHPIELVDGPRLVELVNEALGPKGRRDKRSRLVLISARPAERDQSFSSNECVDRFRIHRKREVACGLHVQFR